ncbi:MAG: hypothetical protein RIA69_03410 [Cyclobacteriaceae bacterium]
MESGIEIYRTSDAEVELNVKFENDTIWLNQHQMTELFDQTKQNISLHVNNCFKEGKLKKSATVKESLTARKEGKRQYIL